MTFLFLMLAEGSAAFDPNSLAAPLSSLGSIGFAVWYAWYQTTVTIPNMLKEHREERTLMQQRFDIATTAMLVEMQAQRRQYMSWMTGTVDSDDMEGSK